MSLKHNLARLLLPPINRIARLVSLKVTPVGTPNRNFPEFFAHLRKLGMEFRTVIDVGVAFGSPTLYASTPQARFHLVEPVPSCKPLLERFARELGARTHNVAAGAADGTMEFFVHSDVSGSSAYRQLEGDILDGERVTVPVRRLDSIIEGPLERPCLLKIDTQGAEIEVLEGAAGLLDQIDVLIIETSFHEFRAGAPEFQDVVGHVAKLGFAAYEILEGHYRSADNALAQVDVAFVRKDSPLRSVKTFFTPDQARRYAGHGQPG